MKPGSLPSDPIVIISDDEGEDDTRSIMGQACDGDDGVWQPVAGDAPDTVAEDTQRYGRLQSHFPTVKFPNSFGRASVEMYSDDDQRGPTWKVGVNIFKAMLGAGMLSLPAVVTQTDLS